MKPSTLFGIIFGVVAIFGAYIWEVFSSDVTVFDSIKTLFMLPAMLIVFGGTFAAALTGSSMEQMLKIPKYFYIAFFPKRHDTSDLINQIVDLSAIARREGILALEPRLKSITHPYLMKLFKICIDGADPETLQEIVETELGHITTRHYANIELFQKMGGFSPTMGIIGTVMGLIATLAAAGSDPNVLIHHIATAFIATMWGIFMANIVWIPVADKLRNLHKEEVQTLEVLLDGVKSVQLGETPSVIRAKLISVFPLQEQDKLIAKHNKIINPISPLNELKTQKYL